MNSPKAFQNMQIYRVAQDQSSLQSDHHFRFFRFLYIKTGTGWMKTKSGKKTIQGNSLLWLCPGENSEVVLHDGADGYYLSLPDFSLYAGYDPQLIYHPRFLRLLTTTGILSNDEDTGSLFDMLLKTIGDELENFSSFGTEIIHRYIKIFILHLLRKMEAAEQMKIDAPHNQVVQAFHDLLEKNFRTKKQVSEYAAVLCLSSSHLNTIIRKSTGHPVSYHIKQRIILEAKRRAVFTDMCMKQMACELGFTDISRFSKYFKSATGINFTDFKQQTYLLPMTA